MADGEDEGVFDTDAEGEGEAEGVLDTDAEGDGDADGEAEVEAEGDVDGLPEAEAEAMTVPRFPSRASQRYEPPGPDPEIVTEISERKSLASANVAFVSSATLYPAGAVTTMSPPPSVFILRTKRMPGFVGFASVRVSPDAPEVISQICRSLFGRMIPALPGSVMIFGPRYRKCRSWWGEFDISVPFVIEEPGATAAPEEL